MYQDTIVTILSIRFEINLRMYIEITRYALAEVALVLLIKRNYTPRILSKR